MDIWYKNAQRGSSQTNSNLRARRLPKHKDNFVVSGTGNSTVERIKGRERHIVVDTMGNLLAIIVHTANIHDTKSGIDPVRKACQMHPTL